MASLALAWHFTRPVVASPIIGASKPHHIEAAVAALDLTLSAEDLTAIEGPYRPKAPSAMSMGMAPPSTVSRR